MDICFQFDAEKVWDHLIHTLDVNVFMAVPTIYVKLIQAHGSLSDEIRPLVKRKLVEKMRLMVSGSAALPTPVLQQWLEISGHTLLERYLVLFTQLIMLLLSCHFKLLGLS